MARHQTGLSMIEVLVAIVILSVGILGTAALQAQSKRANIGAVERTLASMLVNDIFERMRANPSQFIVYLNAMAAAQKVGETAGTQPTSCVGADKDCSPAQLAAWDVWDWSQSLIGASEVSVDVNTGGLVLPIACMIGPPAGGEGYYTVIINWRGHSEFTEGTAPPDPCNANATGRYDGDAGTGSLRRAVVVRTYLNE